MSMYEDDELVGWDDDEPGIVVEPLNGSDLSIGASEYNAQSNADDTDTYSTDPDEAILTSPGWVQYRGDEITALPLTDRKTGLFARLKYEDALKVAKRLGAELLTEDDHIGIHEGAKTSWKEPINGFVESFEIPYHNLPAGPHMASLKWAKDEDALIRQSLAEIWDGEKPVANVGKYWLDGGYNFGWWLSPKAAAAGDIKSRDKKGNLLIQPKSGAHIDSTGRNTHTDYSQLTMLKKKKGGIASAWAMLTSGEDPALPNDAERIKEKLGKARQMTVGFGLADIADPLGIAHGPSGKEKEKFAALKAEWQKLYDWGIKEHVPYAHPQWESWEKYSADWANGNADLDLTGQAEQLAEAQRMAKDFGYPDPYKVQPMAVPSREGGPPIAPATTATDSKFNPISVPSADERTTALAAAASIDEAQKTAKSLMSDFAKELADANRQAQGAVLNALPWYVKVGAAAALVMGTAVGVIYLKSQVGAFLPRSK